MPAADDDEIKQRFLEWCREVDALPVPSGTPTWRYPRSRRKKNLFLIAFVCAGSSVASTTRMRRRKDVSEPVALERPAHSRLCELWLEWRKSRRTPFARCNRLIDCVEVLCKLHTRGWPRVASSKNPLEASLNSCAETTIRLSPTSSAIAFHLQRPSSRPLVADGLAKATKALDTAALGEVRVRPGRELRRKRSTATNNLITLPQQAMRTGQRRLKKSLSGPTPADQYSPVDQDTLLEQRTLPEPSVKLVAVKLEGWKLAREARGETPRALKPAPSWQKRIKPQPSRPATATCSSAGGKASWTCIPCSAFDPGSSPVSGRPKGRDPQTPSNGGFFFYDSLSGNDIVTLLNYPLRHGTSPKQEVCIRAACSTACRMEEWKKWSGHRTQSLPIADGGPDRRFRGARRRNSP